MPSSSSFGSTSSRRVPTRDSSGFPRCSENGRRVRCRGSRRVRPPYGPSHQNDAPSAHRGDRGRDWIRPRKLEGIPNRREVRQCVLGKLGCPQHREPLTGVLFGQIERRRGIHRVAFGQRAPLNLDVGLGLHPAHVLSNPKSVQNHVCAHQRDDDCRELLFEGLKCPHSESRPRRIGSVNRRKTMTRGRVAKVKHDRLFNVRRVYQLGLVDLPINLQFLCTAPSGQPVVDAVVHFCRSGASVHIRSDSVLARTSTDLENRQPVSVSQKARRRKRTTDGVCCKFDVLLNLLVCF